MLQLDPKSLYDALAALTALSAGFVDPTPNDIANWAMEPENSAFRPLVFAAIIAAGPSQDFDPSDDEVGYESRINLFQMKGGKPGSDLDKH